MSYRSLFLSFLRIGSIAFGGFMALVSVVQQDIVNRKKWITDETVLDGISLATILPGPVAVNLVAYVGYNLRGIRGALISMFAVILPSFLLVYLLSYLYFGYGQITAVQKLFAGFLPSVIAIIIAVGINLSKKHVREPYQWIIMLVSGVLLYFIGGYFLTLLIILVSGLIGIFMSASYRQQLFSGLSTGLSSAVWQNKSFRQLFIFLGFVFLAYLLVALLIPAGSPYLLYRQLLFTFSSLSITLFGGGYVFIPMIQKIVVEQMHWLTTKEFADAIAMGQVTPGPIMISATFIGYKAGGFIGSVVSTVGIFLPSGLLMLVGSHVLKTLKNQAIIESLYKGIRPAVVGMILAAAVIIGKSVEWNWISLLIFTISLIAILKYQVNVIWIIPISGLTWYLLS